MLRGDAIIKRFESRLEERLIGAEVGVYKGSLSRYLLSNMENLELYLIDRWEKYTRKEKKLNEKSSMSTKPKKTFDTALRKTIKIASLFPSRAIIIKKSSVMAAREFNNKYFDFVFLDADHSYSAVKKDIKSWCPKIKPGGYICGHDYHRAGVFNAVNRMFSSMDIEIDQDTTWFVRLR